MPRSFDAFVIFAEMRTGSNHLEETLAALPDVTCLGEVYNPTFIGRHNRFELAGYDLARRARDPLGFLSALRRSSDGIAGFRYFHDHEPRVLDAILSDTRIAKVLLTRNPLDSYVSRKIASATGQWRLTDARHARQALAKFDAAEFNAMLDAWAGFRDAVRRGLQVTGQTMFHIRYEDINDIEVLNGLAAFVGSSHRLEAPSQRLKRQNPQLLHEKVSNPEVMDAAVARLDPLGLDRVSETDVPRAAGVPGWMAHPVAGLLFIPVPGGPVDSVADWMAAVGGVGRDGLVAGMSQKDLRVWMRRHPGFVSFSVVRHPVLRALAALRSQNGPEFGPGMAPAEATLLRVETRLKGQLGAQADLRIAPEWGLQTAHLQAAAQVVVPQRVFREAEAGQGLRDIADAMGLSVQDYVREDDDLRAAIGMEPDAALQKAISDAYRRDFIQLGFDPLPDHAARVSEPSVRMV